MLGTISNKCGNDMERKHDAMTQKTMRILQCFVSNKVDGVTQSIYNNYKYMDKGIVKYDFLYIHGKPWFAKELEMEGSRFIEVPSLKHPFSYFNTIRMIVAHGKYDAVYFNLSFAHIIPILAAYAGHAKNILVHAHSSSIDRKQFWKRLIIWMYHCLSKSFWNYFIDYRFACSTLAGNFLFGKKYVLSKKFSIIHNAIELEKYKYTESTRFKVREELGISPHSFVVGHVGRFSYQKNHPYLIRIFKEICNKHPDSVLLQVGDGADKEQAQLQVQQEGLAKKVIFLGIRKDVNRLLQAMDIFILPSLFEGLCIGLVEAQAAGLPCLASDTTPEESKVSPLVRYLSIKDKPEVWGEFALDFLIYNRDSPLKSLAEHGYDNHREAQRLQNILVSMR